MGALASAYVLCSRDLEQADNAQPSMNYTDKSRNEAGSSGAFSHK